MLRKYMKHVRIHFVYLGGLSTIALASQELRELTPSTWFITTSTIAHHTRENDIATADALAKADGVICVGKHTYEELAKRWHYDARKLLVWPETHYTVKQIRQKCQELAEYLTAGLWVDVLEKNGDLTGLTLPIQWVADRSFWHYGVHVVILTKKGNAVLQVRSKDTTCSPSRIDITLGGVVGAGETPERAAVREVYEELGLRVRSDQLYLLATNTHVGWHRSRHRLSRVINYAYMVVIDEGHTIFRPEFSEVKGIALCTNRQIRQLLTGAYVPHIGRLTVSHKYYNTIVNRAYRILHRLYGV